MRQRDREAGRGLGRMRRGLLYGRFKCLHLQGCKAGPSFPSLRGLEKEFWGRQVEGGRKISLEGTLLAPRQR